MQMNNRKNDFAEFNTALDRLMRGGSFTEPAVPTATQRRRFQRRNITAPKRRSRDPYTSGFNSKRFCPNSGGKGHGYANRRLSS